MILHKENITENMDKVAKVIFDTLDKDFYLAGGTALALRIGHRKSIDLDYFINKDFDTLQLKNKILEIFHSERPASAGRRVQILFEEKNTLWCLIDGVKVSFISRFDILLDQAEVIDNFRLIGTKDITVMKLSAICGREEYKDYFDLACIANITDVRSWIFWWQKVYENVDITSWIIALSAVDMIQEIPLEISENFKNKNIQIDIKKITQEITEILKK